MDSSRIAQETLEKYIRTRILPALKAQDRDYGLDLFKAGSRNLIWFLTVGGDRYVLKALSKRFRIKNVVRAHAYLTRRGIPVPRLFFADASKRTGQSIGYFMLCEERVDGTPIAELSGAREEHWPQIAAFFARMHGNRSFKWGKIKSFQFSGFRDYLIRKAAARAEAIAAAGCTLAGRPAADLPAWFMQKGKGLRPLMRFNLCHGDVNMKNIMLCPGGGIRLIDTEAFKFLPFQIEYFRLLYSICGFDAARQRIFADAYLAAAPPENRRALDACGGLYRAYVLLEFAWHCNKKLKQGQAAGPDRDFFIEGRAAALEQLAALISEDR